VVNTINFVSLTTKTSVLTVIRIGRFIMGKVANSYISLPSDITS